LVLVLGLLLVFANRGDGWAEGGRPSALGNRLTHLDVDDPFHAGLDSSRLTTPQWVGEPGVEAVVILAIDDLRDPMRYESFLRPLLERLKRIDGRAPVSIFCNALDPAHPQFAAWSKEGLSLEVHTLSHPCPLLGKAGFKAARETYEGGIDEQRESPILRGPVQRKNTGRPVPHD
jgi:hypothetical protein